MADEVQETREVRTTDAQVGNTNVQRQTVKAVSSAPMSIVAQRVVWYIVGFIVVVLALRLVLQLLGANEGNGFVDLVYAFSGVFAAPFFGMFSYTPAYGVSYFEVSTIVAMLIYSLLGWGIAKLFTLNSNHPAA
ncbi:MAG: hypothetical protein WBB39_02095 [Candidatus Saccharimonadales bacterium]